MLLAQARADRLLDIPAALKLNLRENGFIVNVDEKPVLAVKNVVAPTILVPVFWHRRSIFCAIDKKFERTRPRTTHYVRLQVNL